MAIILDADVIIRGEKGTFDLQGWVRGYSDEEFAIAAITVAELWQGMERASATQRGRRQQYLEAVLSALPVLPYTEQTAYEHARLWAELEGAGKLVGAYDLIVAATAVERNSAVATFNRRHFGLVPGLKLIEPR